MPELNPMFVEIENLRKAAAKADKPSSIKQAVERLNCATSRLLGECIEQEDFDNAVYRAIQARQHLEFKPWKTVEHVQLIDNVTRIIEEKKFPCRPSFAFKKGSRVMFRISIINSFTEGVVKRVAGDGTWADIALADGTSKRMPTTQLYLMD